MARAESHGTVRILNQTAECHHPHIELIGRLRPLTMEKTAQVGLCGRWFFGEAVTTRRVAVESDALWMHWFKHQTRNKDSSQWEVRCETMSK